MMELWHEDMVRFMRDASEYGSYNRELAARLMPELNREMHICDAGCGLGYLSLELAPYVGQVTAVEKNPHALAVLEENCRARKITNILPRCGSIGEVLPAEKYDGMVFCLFGSIQEILETARKQCAGRVFIVTRNYTRHRFSAGDHPVGGYGYEESKKILKQLKIPFGETVFDLEFGQPFRSYADARRFFEIYSKDMADITEDFLRGRVVETGNAAFPLYMPHRRKLAILKLHTVDLSY